jgi:triosephosphate isomerase
MSGDGPGLPVAGGRGAERVPLIAGNWKMHKSSRAGAAFVGTLAERIGTFRDRDVMVAPPFTGLCEAVKAAEGTGIDVAAQDVFWENQGAFTGEVAPGMLADLGVKGVIVGHSERRQLFGETDEAVGRKVRAALDHDLLPILCVGETEGEREAALTEAVLARQVPAGLAAVRPDEGGLIAIAYEPIWAIGTGKTATPQMAQEAAAYVRAQVAEALGIEAAQAVRILYGGSVRSDNIDELMAQPDIDGVLVGGASLQLDCFARIAGFEKP